MKKFYPTIPMLLLFFLFSCQEEVTEITDVENEQEFLVANSTLVNLMLETSLMDGSEDNAVDSTSALSIHFPIDVVLNGEQELTIFSAEEIEAQMETYEDYFDMVFPITATTATYEEIDFENIEQLETFYEPENELDDNECISFEYPFSLSIYNTQTEAFETFVVENDAALYSFLTSLTLEMLVSLDYPISLSLSDGTEITVNSNEELQDTILDAVGTCDENDDPYNQDMLQEVFANCYWNFFINENYQIIFNANGTFEVETTENEYFSGNWGLQIGNEDVLSLEIEAADLPIEGNWTISNFQSGTNGYFFTFENSDFLLQQDCSPQTACATTVTSCEIETGYAEYILAEQDHCMVELAMMDHETATVSYHLSLSDAQEGINQLISNGPYVNTNQFSQYIYVRVEDGISFTYEIVVVLLVTENC